MPPAGSMYKLFDQFAATVDFENEHLCGPKKIALPQYGSDSKRWEDRVEGDDENGTPDASKKSLDTCTTVIWPVALKHGSFFCDRYGNKACDIEFVKGLQIVELGAGVGILGVILAHLGVDIVKKVVISDQSKECCQKSIDYLEAKGKSTDQSLVSTEAAQASLQASSRLEARVIRWGVEKDIEKNEMAGLESLIDSADIVVAADVIYCQGAEIMQALAWTMKKCLKKKKEALYRHKTEGGQIREVKQKKGEENNVNGFGTVESFEIPNEPHILLSKEFRGDWFTLVEFTDACEAEGIAVKQVIELPKLEEDDALEYLLYVLVLK